MTTILTPKIRAALYSLGIAAGAVLSVYGVATDEQVAVWLGAFASLLNVLAVANVPRGSVDE